MTDPISSAVPEPVETDGFRATSPLPANLVSDVALPNTQKATASTRGTRRSPWRIAGFAAAAMVCAASLPVYRAFSQAPAPPPALTALVPQDAEAVASASPEYFWNLTTSIRALPQVQTALDGLQTNLGVTYDDDIQPWLGEVGFFGSNFGHQSPDLVVLLQVKDQAGYAAFLDKVKNKIAAKGAAFQDEQFDGITYEVLGNGPISIVTLDGWVAIASTQSAMDELLNTYTAKTPSISSSAKWQPALERLDAPSKLSGVVDMGEVIKAFKALPQSGGQNNALANPMVAKYANSLVAFSYDDSDKVLRTDAVAIPETPLLQSTWHKYASKMGPVTSLPLQKVPDAAIITIFSNPAFLTRMEIPMIESAGGQATPAQTAASMQKIEPYLEIADHFTGQAAIAITWNPSKGFGFVALAQADQPAAAVRAARVIARAVASAGVPVANNGTTWSIPLASSLFPSLPSLPLSPEVVAQDRWLEITSDPIWLGGGATPTLSLPAEAGTASSVAVGNFTWVPTVLDLIGKSVTDKDADAQHGLEIIRGLHLDSATWSGSMSIDPDGSASHSDFELRNFDLKGAFDNTVSEISAWNNPPKGPGDANAGTAVPGLLREGAVSPNGNGIMQPGNSAGARKS